MLKFKFSENFEFFKEKFRKIPILKEFEWFEWFEWFGPSPIEPFNSVQDRKEFVDGPVRLPAEWSRPPHGGERSHGAPLPKLLISGIYDSRVRGREGKWEVERKNHLHRRLRKTYADWVREEENKMQCKSKYMQEYPRNR